MCKAVFLNLFFLVSTLCQTYQSSEQPTLENIFSVKETFRYEVKYSFFKLGWVEVSILPDTLFNGKMHKHILTKIESNSRVPLVGTEEDYFHSLFYVNEDGIPITSAYWKDNVDENLYKEITYDFDREAGKVYYKEEDNTRDTLDLVEPATAGHVVFLFSRLFAGSGQSTEMNVYVTKKAGKLYFENYTEKEKRNYAPFEGPVDTYLVKGSTENIAGPFNFSGKFRAWFLADDLRVPLEARVRVLFGNAIVRLIEYKQEKI